MALAISSGPTGFSQGVHMNRASATEPPALVLASGSPRRAALLREAGYKFLVRAPEIEETPLPDESPAAMVTRLAVEKARAVAAVSTPPCLVLGADTAVVAAGKALGKPSSPEDAIATLLRLGGEQHTVITGYAVVDAADATGRPVVGVESTLVVMKPVTRAMAAEYVATGEPMDKAGSYAIQGGGGRLVERIVGSYSNVAGLPMESVASVLTQLGVLPQRPEGGDAE
jgi:septum formation protein